MEDEKIKKGFTLIELLVVIAIIGLLSSVVLASLDTARMKARDAKRISDLRQLYTALMLYYDSNGAFPCTSGTIYTNGSDCLSTTLSPKYISSVPMDPRYGSSGGWGRQYQYFARTNPNRFNLRAGLEGTPVKKTGNYPGGTACNTSELSDCNWNETCVYEGYEAVSGCGLTIQYGENNL